MRETEGGILAASLHPLPVSSNMMWPYKDSLQQQERTVEAQTFPLAEVMGRRERGRKTERERELDRVLVRARKC